MRKNSIGVAFDLDGTLYPNYRLNIRLIPFLLKYQKLLRALGKARDILRREVQNENTEGRFYDAQAALMAKILKADPDLVKEQTEQLIYRGWEPFFHQIAPFKYVHQTLADLRAAGYTLGILSDFPPETKLANMGLSAYWDVRICSETVGHLKPDPAPFRELAAQMGCAPERIIYVGNSVAYDIIGAKNAGMQAALVSRPFKKKPSKSGNADFIFSDYRQFRNFMLS